MKLYKQQVIGEVLPVETHWSGSQTEASKKRTEWKRAGVKMAQITTSEVDVPTSKTGLLEFLNGRQD